MGSSEQYTIEVPYRIKYTNKDPVPVKELIKSLESYEKLLCRTVPFVTSVCNGAEIVDIQVYVNKVQSGSLLEDFLVKVVFKDKDNYEKALEVGAKMFDKNAVITSAVCVGVAAYISLGVYNACVNSGNKQQPISINAYNGAIVQTGGTMNIPEDLINDIVNKTNDKAALTKEVLGVIAPAQLEEGAIIEVGELETLNIPNDVIIDTPRDYVPPEKFLENETLIKVKILISASDKDKHARWAGVVPGHVEKRIDFVLNEAISPSRHHGKLEAFADIIITSERKNKDKELLPKKIEIIKFYSN
ncbi:MAG: hypothetical protein OCC45_10435 [Desulfotalea sp.]